MGAAGSWPPAPNCRLSWDLCFRGVCLNAQVAAGLSYLRCRRAKRSLSDVSERCRPSESRAAVHDPNAFNGSAELGSVGVRIDVAQATERGARYVVIRSYSGQGASELFDLLGQREEDVRSVISGVPGFVSYAAFARRRRDGRDGMPRQGWHRRVFATCGRVGEGERQHDVDPPTITEGSTFLRSESRS